MPKHVTSDAPFLIGMTAFANVVSDHFRSLSCMGSASVHRAVKKFYMFCSPRCKKNAQVPPPPRPPGELNVQFGRGVIEVLCSRLFEVRRKAGTGEEAEAHLDHCTLSQRA